MPRKPPAKPHYRQAPIGHVYFVRCPSLALVKIGFSSNHPDTRLEQFRCVSPAPLEPIGYFMGKVRDEKALHVRFKDDWSHAEWFRSTPDLEAHMAAVCRPWVFRGTPGLRAPFPEATTPPINNARWADLTYVVIGAESRSVAEWMALYRCTRPLWEVKDLLNRAKDPFEVVCTNREVYVDRRRGPWARPAEPDPVPRP